MLNQREQGVFGRAIAQAGRESLLVFVPDSHLTGLFLLQIVKEKLVFPSGSASARRAVMSRP